MPGVIALSLSPTQDGIVTQIIDICSKHTQMDSERVSLLLHDSLGIHPWRQCSTFKAVPALCLLSLGIADSSMSAQIGPLGGSRVTGSDAHKANQLNTCGWSIHLTKPHEIILKLPKFYNRVYKYKQCLYPLMACRGPMPLEVSRVYLQNSPQRLWKDSKALGF